MAHLPDRLAEAASDARGAHTGLLQGEAGAAAAIAAIARGEFVVVADDVAREDEGDLICAAETVTPQMIAFMVRHTTGIICVSLPDYRLDELELPMMTSDSTDKQGTAFTVSVDAQAGTTTGVSAADRATTIQTLSDARATSDDFVRPGHVFPLRARPGGVLKRPGHTEAALDLAQLAGFSAGVLSELVNDDGTMARGQRLQSFAREHGLVMITIADLIRYQRRRDTLVARVASSRMPTKYGDFTAHAYRSRLDNSEHLALVHGNVAAAGPVLVRVHSECLTGDILGSCRCDCGEQLGIALSLIASEGAGVVVYLRGQEGRGIGLAHKIRAYALQDQGRDTVDANLDLGLPVDAREYGIGAAILTHLGISQVRLMTNNPAKQRGLRGYGLEIVGRVPLLAAPHPARERYTKTKQHRLGHLGLADADG